MEKKLLLHTSRFHTQNIFYMYLIFHFTYVPFTSTEGAVLISYLKITGHKFTSLLTVKPGDEHQSSFLCLNSAIKPPGERSGLHLLYWCENYPKYECNSIACRLMANIVCTGGKKIKSLPACLLCHLC